MEEDDAMSFWDTITGQSASDTSNAAAADTYRKQLAASGGIRAAGDKYRGNMYDIGRSYDPYVQSGNSAMQRLMTGLGLPGGDGADFAAAYRNLPGYKSGLETGTNAALRGQNSSGMSNSGRALKELQRYGSDYEDQRVGEYFNRLGGVAGQGLQATGARAGVQSQGEGGALGAYTTAGQQDYGSAGTVGEGMVAGEQAKSDAWGRLLGAGTMLGGSFLGGGGGGNIFSNLMGRTNQGQSGYGNTRGDWNPNVPGGRLV